MFSYVYVIQSQITNQLYIGVSDNLRRRLAEHNKKLNFSTRKDAPWDLIFYEAYRNRRDAGRREKYLKTSQGVRLLKRMLKEYMYERSKN